MAEKMLEESWQRKTEEERGESHEEKASSIYYDIKEVADKDPVLSNLIKDAEKGIRDYARAVLRANQLRAENAPLGDIQAAEDHRSIIHDSLISTMRILSRNFHKRGLDNSWQSVIGLNPENRKVLGQWALDVALGVSERKEE